MADQLEFNRLTAFDSEGDPVSGAKAYFYETGTLTPLTVYSDEALSVAHASPLVADSSGVFAPVYYGGSTAVKVVVTTSADASLYTTDPVRRVAGSSSSAAGVTFAPTSDIPSTNVQAAIERVQQNAMRNFNVVSKTAGYTVISTDKSNLIRCTASLTLALTAASTLGVGFTFTVQADGGDVTIDPNASETINGATTLLVEDGNVVDVYCDGTSFFAFFKQPQSALSYTDAHGVVQRVTASTAVFNTLSGLIPIDDTKPQSTEGEEIFTLAITPTNASNIIRIEGVAHMGHSASGALGTVAIFKNSEIDPIDGGVFLAHLSTNGICYPVPIFLEFVAGGTSEITLKMRAGTTSNTGYLNGSGGARKGGGALTTWLTATEVKV